MEENNNYCEVNYSDNKVNFFEKHPILKHLLYGLLALLGAFLAFYVVTDWYFKSMLDPVHQMKRMDKAIERRDRQMEKTFKKAFVGTEMMQERANRLIHLEQDSDKYKIIVDLVPLNDNERNVEVKTNGNILTVRAAGIHGMGNKKSIMEVSQSYMFND
ncbi:hypothetical protein IJZ97_00880, partial [bacterium]|nr:hypothetical protein [bacterium]